MVCVCPDPTLTAAAPRHLLGSRLVCETGPGNHSRRRLHNYYIGERLLSDDIFPTTSASQSASCDRALPCVLAASSLASISKLRACTCGHGSGSILEILRLLEKVACRARASTGWRRVLWLSCSPSWLWGLSDAKRPPLPCTAYRGRASATALSSPLV